MGQASHVCLCGTMARIISQSQPRTRGRLLTAATRSGAPRCQAGLRALLQRKQKGGLEGMERLTGSPGGLMQAGPSLRSTLHGHTTHRAPEACPPTVITSESRAMTQRFLQEPCPHKCAFSLPLSPHKLHFQLVSSCVSICRTDITSHAKTLGRTVWFPSVGRTGGQGRRKLDQVLKAAESQGRCRGSCVDSRGLGREGKRESLLSGRCLGAQSFPQAPSVNFQIPPSPHPCLWTAAKSIERVKTCPGSRQKQTYIRNAWLAANRLHPGFSAVKLL